MPPPDADTIPHDSDDHDRDRGDGASRCTHKNAASSGPCRRLSLVYTVACRQFPRRKSAAVRFPSAGRWPGIVLTVSSRPESISLHAPVRDAGVDWPKATPVIDIVSACESSVCQANGVGALEN